MESIVATPNVELLDKITDLNRLVLEGKLLEAFEKHYHENVVMQENEDLPTIGKAANREREKAFVAKTEWRRAVPMKVAVGENVTMVEWHYDYTHADYGPMNYRQVSVAEWQDSQIIKEKFYYKL